MDPPYVYDVSLGNLISVITTAPLIYKRPHTFKLQGECPYSASPFRWYTAIVCTYRLCIDNAVSSPSHAPSPPLHFYPTLTFCWLHSPVDGPAPITTTVKMNYSLVLAMQKLEGQGGMVGQSGDAPILSAARCVTLPLSTPLRLSVPMFLNFFSLRYYYI
jgi:hypothetical protein